MNKGFALGGGKVRGKGIVFKVFIDIFVPWGIGTNKFTDDFSNWNIDG